MLIKLMMKIKIQRLLTMFLGFLQYPNNQNDYSIQYYFNNLYIKLYTFKNYKINIIRKCN